MQIVTSEGKIIAMVGYEDLSSLENNENFTDLISQFERSQEEQADKDKSLWDDFTEEANNNNDSNDSIDS